MYLFVKQLYMWQRKILQKNSKEWIQDGPYATKQHFKSVEVPWSWRGYVQGSHNVWNEQSWLQKSQ